MNQRGQFDEFNLVFLALALAGGALAWFIAGRVPDISKVIPIMSGIFTIVVIYFYLVFSDR